MEKKLDVNHTRILRAILHKSWSQHHTKTAIRPWKKATETYGMLQTASGPSRMNRASAFGCHKRFKEARESVQDDERYGGSKEVNTPELIAQRVRVTMLRFKGGSGRDSVRRG